MKTPLTLGLASLTAILFGCASVPSGPTTANEMKSEITNYQLPKLADDGKAIIYVVRPSIDCKPHSFTVFVDNMQPDSEMGTTQGSQYIYFDISPGEHKIISKVNYWNTFAEKNISVKAGDILFLQQEPNMGFITLENNLININDHQGKYYVKTLTPGKFSKGSQQIVMAAVTQQQRQNENGPPDVNVFTGAITGGRIVRESGFSFPLKLNLRLEGLSDHGDKIVLYVRADSKTADANGNTIEYLDVGKRAMNKKVEIKYFTINDASGGFPSEDGFSYEVGEKGASFIRILQ